MRQTGPDIYLVRHGRTALSARHLVNGDVTRSVWLDDAGRRQCRDLVRSAPWLRDIATCVTSEFPRTQQTAEMLLHGVAVDRVVEPLLNEIDYGRFEGGPWLSYGRWMHTVGTSAVPPGARESRDDAIRRMLLGLQACLAMPRPCLVVGHGLLVSVLIHLSGDTPISGAVLTEAPYVAPFTSSFAQLEALVNRGLIELQAPTRNRSEPASADRYAVHVPATSNLEP